jgi:hypothetical protein
MLGRDTGLRTARNQQCPPVCELPSEACGPVCVDKSATRTIAALRHDLPGVESAGKCVGKGFGHDRDRDGHADPVIAQTSPSVQLLANAVLPVNQQTINVLAYDEVQRRRQRQKPEMWLGMMGAAHPLNFTSSKD